MNVEFQERMIKIRELELNLKKIGNLPILKQPQPSSKNMFHGKNPKNRKNLKKFEQKNIETNKNAPIFRGPSISSIIENNKNGEFLRANNPNGFLNTIRTIQIPNFQNEKIKNSSSSKNLLKKRFPRLTLYNTLENKNKMIPNYSNYIQPIKSKNFELVKKKTSSKSTKDIENETKTKQKSVEELYDEFIQNVSQIFIIIIII